MNSLDSQLSRASDGYHAKSTSVLLGRIYVGIRDESISTPTCLVGEPILPRSTTPFHILLCVLPASTECPVVLLPTHQDTVSIPAERYAFQTSYWLALTWMLGPRSLKNQPSLKSRK